MGKKKIVRIHAAIDDEASSYASYHADILITGITIPPPRQHFSQHPASSSPALSLGTHKNVTLPSGHLKPVPCCEACFPEKTLPFPEMTIERLFLKTPLTIDSCSYPVISSFIISYMANSVVIFRTFEGNNTVYSLGSVVQP